MSFCHFQPVKLFLALSSKIFVFVCLYFLQTVEKSSCEDECSFVTFPNVVSLRYAKSTQICGGVLLQQRWVLTAGHCVYDLTYNHISPLKLVAVGKDFNTHRFLEIRVEEIFIPEFYDPKTIERDYSVLRLTRSFPRNTPFTEIAGKSLVEFYIASQNITALAFVWEASRDKDIKKIIPICIDSKICFPDVCAVYYRKAYVEESMICTLSNDGRIPCRGDSGSPLFVYKILVGLVSYGTACTIEGVPSAYARTDAALDFINSVIVKFGVTLANKTYDGEHFVYYMPRSRHCNFVASILLILLLICSCSLIK